MASLVEICRTARNAGEAFAVQAAARPEAPAITAGTRTATYGEIQCKAKAVAQQLRSLGVERGDRVALVGDRSIELIIAMIGVWQAGAAFVPIDPRYPEARIAETLADSEPRLILADDPLRDAAWVAGHTFFSLQECCSTGAASGSVSGPDASFDLDDLAYVIYTSGSTGKPKGVMVSHRNLLRLFPSTDAWFCFNEADVWTLFHSPSFDFSVWEIWGALLSGGRLVVVPYETCRDPQAMLALLANEAVTVLNQSPSAFSMLIQADAQASAPLTALRYVIFGGEALNLRSLLPWFARHPEQPALINMYGITETTVHVTHRRITSDDSRNETDSLIGEPIPDLTLQIFDEAMQPVEDGELYVGGAGVSLGYLRRPELTAERFVHHSSGRLYRTGDHVRRRSDGELVYLGRKDEQVQWNGFRIEPGEVETALLKADGVLQACVLLRDDALGDRILVAYVVIGSDDFDERRLAQHARTILPGHAVPSRFVPIDRVPLTINGKADRALLRAMALPSLVATKGTSGASQPSVLENRVLRAWRGVLGSPDFNDPTLNFFEAGGTSLRLHMLRKELEEELRRSVSIVELFRFPTARSFAASISNNVDQPSSIDDLRRPVKQTSFRPLVRTGKEMQR